MIKDHYHVFFMLLIALEGLLSAIFVYHSYKQTRYKPLYPLFWYTLMMSFFPFIAYVKIYISVNLRINNLAELSPLFQKCVMTSFAAICCVLLWMMLKLWLYFNGNDNHVRVDRICRNVFIVIVLIYAILKFINPQGLGMIVLNIFDNYIFENIIALEILFLIGMLTHSRKERNALKKKMIKAFAWLYLGRYIYLILVLILKEISPVIDQTMDKSAGVIPLVVVIFFALIFLFGFPLIIIIPVIWIIRYLRPYLAVSILPTEDSEALLNEIIEDYAISKREAEILKLLLCGKSNKEIEDMLFISYHTVKNHITNIFQKMGVTSRYELMFKVNSKIHN